VSTSASAIALAQAVGGDIKTLTTQLQASQQEVASLTQALESANVQIQALKDRLDAMPTSPPVY